MSTRQLAPLDIGGPFDPGLGRMVAVGGRSGPEGSRRCAWARAVPATPADTEAHPHVVVGPERAEALMRAAVGRTPSEARAWMRAWEEGRRG